MKLLVQILRLILLVLVGAAVVSLGWVSVLAFVVVSPVVLAVILGVWIFRQALK